MVALVVIVVGLPLLTAGVVLALHSRPRLSRRMTLIATGITALCALALCPHTGDSPVVVVEWLPGAGLMGLTINTTGLYALLVTTWGAFLLLLVPSITEGGGYKADPPPLSLAAILLALAATNTAFLTDHFLARYAALEIVALCIALAPLIEMRKSTGIHLSWSNYLILRLGDAGLLIAILILKDTSGTLSISPALEAGSVLDTTRMGLVVAGFILAVWVKLAIWPFHLWGYHGRRLALTSQVWLYATIMPNLGLYLLYRVTPLLALAGPLRTAVLWLGAGGAVLAMLLALTKLDLRGALVYVGAAQGGLALFTAASGVQPVIWLGLLTLTPLRILLFLTADAAQGSVSPTRRRVMACLFALGGLMLAGFGLLTTWWAREAGVILGALLVAEVTVALTGVWTVHAGRRFLSDPKGFVKPLGSLWLPIGLLGMVVLTCFLIFEPLVHRLAASSHMVLPAIPTLPVLLSYVANTPTVLVMALVLALWWIQRRLKLRPLASAPLAKDVYILEKNISQLAQALYTVVEVGIAEQIVALAGRVVVQSAHVTYRIVEHKGLEGLLHALRRVVVDGARLAYRVVEHEGLEGFLRRSVRAVLELSRGLQHWHTGRLQRNLLWVTVCLALVVMIMTLFSG